MASGRPRRTAAFSSHSPARYSPFLSLLTVRHFYFCPAGRFPFCGYVLVSLPPTAKLTPKIFFSFSRSLSLSLVSTSVTAGNTLIRRLLVSIPYSLRPTPNVLYAAIAHFSANGTLVRVYHDSVSKRLGFISSIQQCGNSLYGGVLNRDFVVKIDINGN